MTKSTYSVSSVPIVYSNFYTRVKIRLAKRFDTPAKASFSSDDQAAFARSSPFVLKKTAKASNHAISD